jgi:recombination protein RecT
MTTVITNENGEIQTSEQRHQTIQDVLHNENVRSALAEVLPNNLSATRFARIAMSSLRRNPKLLQCNPSSFLSALLQSAALGLEPDTALGHCYLIPYGKEATLVVGYQGYIDLAYRSGAVTSIHANVVREGEEFEWSEGSNPYINHKPSVQPSVYRQGSALYLSTSQVTHAYAVAQLLGGGHIQVVMMKAEIDAIKSRSRASHDGPWITDPIAMFKKTAIRQLRKFIPMSPQARALHMAAALDEQVESGLSQTFEIPQEIFSIPVEKATASTEHATEGPIQARTDDPPAEWGYCPIHENKSEPMAAWVRGKFGYSHRLKAGGWCTPAKLGSQLIDAAGVSDADLNVFLKERFGITRSKLEPDHLEATIEFVDSLVPHEPVAVACEPHITLEEAQEIGQRLESNEWQS